MQKPSLQKARAFTLVELLVVVGVIVILGSLLFSAIMGMRTVHPPRRCQSLLQSLVAAIETMKTDYGYTRALGVDSSGNILPDAQLDKIDLGWELDPRNPLWNPPPDKDADILLNKRLKTYYEVHSSQVKGNHLVDPFGSQIRYRCRQIDQDVDGDGLVEKYFEESLKSLGPNGKPGDDDDIEQLFPKRVFMGK